MGTKLVMNFEYFTPETHKQLDRLRSDDAGKIQERFNSTSSEISHVEEITCHSEGAFFATEESQTVVTETLRFRSG